MPVEFSSDRDGSYVRLTAHGEITDEELLRAVETMYASDEDTRRHRCALLDFRQVARADVSSDTVRRIAQLNIDASKLVTPGAAVALVAPKDAVFGLGRMWEVFVEGTRWKTWVFRDLEEAEAWLEEQLASQGDDAPES